MNKNAADVLYRILYNDAVISSLINEMSGDKSSHSYIVECVDSIVANFVCSLVIRNKLKLNFVPTSHPDVMIIPSDNKKITVDAISEIAHDSIIIPYGNIKIYVINATNETEITAWQHKILKVLEEPPQRSLFLITTVNSNILLPAIRSRAILININHLSENNALSVLECDKVSNSRIVSAICQGNLLMAYQFNKLNPEIFLRNLFDVLFDVRTSARSLVFVSFLTKYKENIDIVLQIMTVVYRDIALFSVNERLLLLKEYKSDIIRLQFISKSVASECIFIINQTKLKLENNLNFNACIDSMVLKILEVLNADSGRSKI